MKLWINPEISELDFERTEATQYLKTPEEEAMFGKYYYYDGLKKIYVNSIPTDLLS